MKKLKTTRASVFTFGAATILGFILSAAAGAWAAEQIKFGRTACWRELVYDNAYFYEYSCPYPSSPGPETNTVDRVDVHTLGSSSPTQVAKLCVRYATSFSGYQCSASLTLSSAVSTFSTASQMAPWQNNGADFAYVWVKVHANTNEYKGFVAKVD